MTVAVTDSDQCHEKSVPSDSGAPNAVHNKRQDRLRGLRKVGNNAVDGGGFSDVWLGELGDGSRVAIKVLRTFGKAHIVEEVRSILL